MELEEGHPVNLSESTRIGATMVIAMRTGERAIGNIVANSVKYMEKGNGRTIPLKSRMWAMAGQVAQSDDEMGIAMMMRPPF